MASGGGLRPTLKIAKLGPCGEMTEALDVCLCLDTSAQDPTQFITHLRLSDARITTDMLRRSTTELGESPLIAVTVELLLGGFNCFVKRKDRAHRPEASRPGRSIGEELAEPGCNVRKAIEHVVVS